MIKGRREDTESKKYVKLIPAVWKAEKKEPEVNSVNSVEEVAERKLWLNPYPWMNRRRVEES